MYRKSVPNDIDKISTMYTELLDYYYEDGVMNYSGWEKDVYPTKDVAIAALSEDSLWVFEIDGQIAGSVVLNNSQALAYKDVNWKYKTSDDKVLVIHTLAISPKFTKRGVASHLLNLAYSYAQNTNMQVIRLDTAENNIIASKLYLKNQYEDAGLFDLKLKYNLPLNKLYRAFERKVFTDSTLIKI